MDLHQMTMAFVSILGICGLCVIVMIVMLITGYIPLDSFSKSPAHAARYAVVSGFAFGLLMAVCVTGFAVILTDRKKVR